MILAPTGPWQHSYNYHYHIHSSTLNLANIDEGYVASLIDRLKNKEISGIDKLSNKHIKAAKNVIAKPLTLMINHMLNTEIFPDKLTQSRVTPIFKANDKRLLSNYRPISQSISKVYEYASHLKLSYSSTLVTWFEPMGIQTKTHNCAPEKNCKNYCISTLYISFHFSFSGIADTYAKRPLLHTII